MTTAQVRSGDEVRTVQLLAISGVGFTPTFAWATDEPRPRLFAYIFPGFLQMIEAGWEANADALASLKDQEPTVPSIDDATPTLTRLLENVSPLLKTSPAKLYDRVRQSTVRLSWGSVPLKSKNVSDAVRIYLQENPTEFPGVTVSKEYVRQYPGKDLAAQIFGTVGQISEDQLEQDRNRGLEQGQKIGQGGIEQAGDEPAYVVVILDHEDARRILVRTVVFYFEYVRTGSVGSR